jgi:hypothetical protein
MPGSATALGRASARNNAPTHVAFRQQNDVGTQKKADFAAQWLAYAIPYRRLAKVCHARADDAMPRAANQTAPPRLPFSR